MTALATPTKRGTVGSPAGPNVRIRAQVADLAVIAGWVTAAAAAGLVARAAGYDFADPSKADLFALATLVAPVTVTFALQEASPRQATFGKRRRGLQVTDKDGHRLRPGRALARSVVKFAPWQLAHSAVFGLLADPSSTSLTALAIGAQLVMVASVATMSYDPGHRTLHDLLAGTRVVTAWKGDVQ